MSKTEEPADGSNKIDVVLNIKPIQPPKIEVTTTVVGNDFLQISEGQEKEQQQLVDGILEKIETILENQRKQNPKK